MDIHNNRIGREVSKNNLDATEDELAIIILGKVKNGELFMLNEGKTALIPTG